FAHGLLADARDRKGSSFRLSLWLRVRLRRSFLCFRPGWRLVFLRVRADAPVAVPHPLLAALPRGDLLDRASGGDRARPLFGDVLGAGAARFVVLALDQQPIVVTVALAGAHPHQVPAPMQLLAVEIEDEVAFGVALERISLGKPAAAIPDHDRAAAV